jgi:hypothetical protein
MGTRILTLQIVLIVSSVLLVDVGPAAAGQGRWPVQPLPVAACSRACPARRHGGSSNIAAHTRCSSGLIWVIAVVGVGLLVATG